MCIFVDLYWQLFVKRSTPNIIYSNGLTLRQKKLQRYKIYLLSVPISITAKITIIHNNHIFTVLIRGDSVQDSSRDSWLRNHQTSTWMFHRDTIKVYQQTVYLYGCVLSSVTMSHQETSPRDRITLAPPDRKSTHTLSSTVRKDENRVLSRNTHYTHLKK